MKHLSVMIKPASSLCNMKCTYCFYADLTAQRTVKSYGMMSQETARCIVDNMLADLFAGDRATLAFQGGEPTLAGMPFFDSLLSYTSRAAAEKGVYIEYALQTNGIELTESWIPLLKAHPVLMGLSIDGDKSLHDSYRKGADGEKGTFKRVMAAKRLLDQHQIPYNVLLTLTNQAARHPQKIWNFILQERIDYVQFTPCLNDFNFSEKTPYALEPERFYRFYSTLLPLWERELQQGRYISVKLFDDLVNYYGKGIPSACGIHGHCAVQFVCEGDGSVFPCDFYMVDEFRMGSLAESKPSELYESGTVFLNLEREYFGNAPCRGCRYEQTCDGGCKRMIHAMYLSGYTCWYAKLLDESLATLLKIENSLRNIRATKDGVIIKFPIKD